MCLLLLFDVLRDFMVEVLDACAIFRCCGKASEVFPNLEFLSDVSGEAKAVLSNSPGRDVPFAVVYYGSGEVFGDRVDVCTRKSG